MNKIFKILLGASICVILNGNITVFAGKALNDYTSYKTFGAAHHQVITGMFTKEPRSIADHKFEMVYPETNKKAKRLEELGLNFIKGELYFLEVPNKGDGVYVSFNEEGLLDAAVIEVNKGRHSALMFTLNEILASMFGLGLAPSSQIDQNDFMNVINGRAPYVDVHCKAFIGDGSFYIRIKDVHRADSPFYRIAIFRP